MEDQWQIFRQNTVQQNTNSRLAVKIQLFGDALNFAHFKALLNTLKD